MRSLAALSLLLALAAPAMAAEDWHARCLAEPPHLAIRACEEALIDDPADSAVLKRLGDLYFANHGEWRAVELYARRLQLEPENAPAYFDHAAALATLWSFADAAPSIRRALDLAPDDLSSQRLAALIFERTGDAAAAFGAHLRLAEMGLTVGMYDVAQDYHYGRGTTADGEQARFWYERAAEGGHVAAMEALAEALPHGALGEADAARGGHWRDEARRIREAYWQR